MTSSPFHGIFSGLQQGSEIQDVPTPPVHGSHTSFEPSNPVKQAGQIAVDIYEQDSYYIIRAPIAGVKLGDLDIEVDGKVVTIHGTRAPAENIPDDQYYLQECFWGEFSRSVTLPCSIDPKKIKATFSKDSILKVIVPKEERVKIVRVSEG
jgi:HSP20 family protein